MRWAGKYGGSIGKLIEGVEWLREHSPLMEANRDPPKPLEELQQAVSEPTLGYDIHHIVEQASARRGNHPEEMIDGSDNLVRIPRMKHWDLNRWYETEKPEFDWQTPRDYLKDKNWEERRRVGLQGLREVGVLKP